MDGPQAAALEAILEVERRGAGEKEARHKLEADRLRRQIKELQVRLRRESIFDCSCPTLEGPSELVSTT